MPSHPRIPSIPPKGHNRRHQLRRPKTVISRVAANIPIIIQPIFSMPPPAACCWAANDSLVPCLSKRMRYYGQGVRKTSHIVSKSGSNQQSQANQTGNPPACLNMHFALSCECYSIGDINARSKRTHPSTEKTRKEQRRKRHKHATDVIRRPLPGRKPCGHCHKRTNPRQPRQNHGGRNPHHPASKTKLHSISQAELFCVDNRESFVHRPFELCSRDDQQSARQ